VARDPPAVRATIGLAGPYAAVCEYLTGRQNPPPVASPTHLPRRAAPRRAQAPLAGSALAAAAHRPPTPYSCWRRRRPDPTPPPATRNDLCQVIEKLVADGTTLLLTTQYLEEADRLADRIAVIDHGRVIAEGTPAELKARLGGTVVGLKLPDPQTAARAATHLADRLDLPARVDGSSVELTVDDGARAVVGVLRALDAAGTPPDGLTVRGPSLDDVFLALTGRPAETDDTDETQRGAA